MEEDMIQLRLNIQQLSSEMTGLRKERESDRLQAHADRQADRKQTEFNHKQNRGSIHDIKDDLQTLSDSVTEVTGKLNDYLLVQQTRDEQRDKAWWKAPLGVAVIVLIVTIGWGIVQKAVLHW